MSRGEFMLQLACDGNLQLAKALARLPSQPSSRIRHAVRPPQVIHTIHEVAALRRQGDPSLAIRENEWRAAMRMYAGLDIGGKRTAICLIDGSGKAVWRGTVDTHPEMIDGALQRFKGFLDKVGLESGPFTPHLFRSLEAIGYPMI